MKKFFLPIMLSASFLLLSNSCSSFAAEPNDIYQWQIQKYPKTQKEFKDITADQSVIQEKPEAISKKYHDKLRLEAIEAKRQQIEENELAAMEGELDGQDIGMNTELNAEILDEEMPADDASADEMNETSNDTGTSDETYSEDSDGSDEWKEPETTSDSPYSGY